MPRALSHCLHWVVIFIALGIATVDAVANADDAWAAVESLDAGPQKSPTTREEAIQFARQHFSQHRAAIESFLIGYPDDPRRFDAQIRLAGILAAEGKMDQKPSLVREALEALIKLEKSPGIPSNKLADAAFRRISLQMQTLEGREAEQRELVVTAARNFAHRFPSDKRSSRLLVEAATICTPVPETMRALLTQAQALTTEPELLARIADDFRRLDRLGKPLDVQIPLMSGSTMDLQKLRGKVIALVFWSAESPHSVLWLQSFRNQLRKIPTSDVIVIGISLDENREDLEKMMQTMDIQWPTAFDGQGWNGKFVRSMGINAIPTLWLVDKRGVLRSLNARENFETTLRLLQRER